MTGGGAGPCAAVHDVEIPPLQLLLAVLPLVAGLAMLADGLFRLG